MKYLKSIIFLFCLFLLLKAGTLKAVEEENSKFEILMDYYSWYNDAEWDNFRTIPLRAFRRPYCSWDPDLVTEQNEEKKSYLGEQGIDVVSWWGEPDHSYDYFKRGYLRAVNFEDQNFCFLYETYGRLLRKDDGFDFADKWNKEKFLKDIQYLEENYFWYNNYYRIDGKPVIYIWTSNLKNFGEVSKLIRKKIYLVGNEGIFFPPDENDKKRIEKLDWYDAITSYGINPGYVARNYGSLTDDCIRDYILKVIKWDRILKKYTPDVELILPVQFAYHDNRGDFDEKGNPRIFYSTPYQVDRFLKTIRYLAKILNYRRIHITSYNEHREGHGAEPSVEYDDVWLRLIRKYFVHEVRISELPIEH